MRVFTFLLLLLALPVMCVFSQTSADQIWYNVVSVPPSPNAAALGKYGEVPVSKVNGTPEISIPILNLGEGGINVPVSLSYHAGGIRVADEPTWVGLGWSLNAGGVITRTMRGLPDDHSKGFLENSEKVPWSAIVNLDFTNTAKKYETYLLVEEVEKGFRDFEPDAFYYNFGTYSGSFVFGNHKGPLTIPIEDMKIEPIFNAGVICGFKVVDPEGIIYIFGDVFASGYTEQTTVTVKGPDQPTYISSWYLQKIVNPLTNSTVNFTYNSYSHSNSTSYSETKLYERNEFGNYYILNTSINQSTVSIPNAKFLSSIQFTNGTINFYNSASDDAGRKLDSIVFKDQRFLFNYDYFRSSPFDGTKNTMRLKLLNFKEKVGSNLYKTHSFDYSSLVLPPKSSKSIDHWGFFNNRSASTTIPKIIYAGKEFGDANRSPDPNYSNASTLTAINYPTGGRSEFSFENNTYSRYPTVEEISTSQTNYFSVTGSLLKTEICKNTNLSTAMSFNSNLSYWGFVLEAQLSISDMSMYNSLHHKGKVEILNDGNQIIYSGTVTLENPISIALNTNLASDFYILKTCATGGVVTLVATIKCYKYDPTQLQQKIDVNAGGLRTSQIRTFDPVSGKTTYKTYDYCKSGYLNSPLPPYYTTIIDERMTGQYTSAEYQRLMIYSSPAGGLGASSNSISYEKVAEYLGTLDNNTGKIVTVFNKNPDETNGGAPYPPQLSLQWLRSKVLKDSVYSCTGPNSYQLVKQTEYQYETDNDHYSKVTGFKATRIKTTNISGVRNYGSEFVYSNFDLLTYNYRLKKKINRDFFNGTEVRTDEDFYYENKHHLNPTRIETNTSDNKILKTVFKYPLDYSNCIDNCEDNFHATLENCKGQYNSCSLEASNCLSKYSTCYSQWLECERNDYTSIIGTYLSTNNHECPSSFESCLNSNGYYSCLTGCGYLPCIINANNQYLICKKNYAKCLVNNYNNATDPNTKAIHLLAIAHNQNRLVEKITYNNNVELEHFKFSYEKVSDKDISLVKKAEKENSNSGFYLESQYDKYDVNGNIEQITLKTPGNVNSYLWGYNKKYPVAQIQNASIDEIKTALGVTTIPDLGAGGLSSSQVSLLKTGLPKAMITTYTYAPLIGMTSQTDPNGVTTYYEYDAFGRLKCIKDDDGRILKTYEYNYKQ